MRAGAAALGLRPIRRGAWAITMLACRSAWAGDDSQCALGTGGTATNGWPSAERAYAGYAAEDHRLVPASSSATAVASPAAASATPAVAATPSVAARAAHPSAVAAPHVRRAAVPHRSGVN